jgi:hypothetical protein
MRGSCLCGQVVYSVEKLSSPPRHCSCNMCRKAHASAFNTSASAKRAEFQWVQGESLLSSFESSPGKRRYFCSACGSHLIAQRTGSETVALRVATLDEDPGLRPKAHVWVSSEVPWLAYNSDVTSFDGWESSAP